MPKYVRETSYSNMIGNVFCGLVSLGVWYEQLMEGAPISKWIFKNKRGWSWGGGR